MGDSILTDIYLVTGYKENIISYYFYLLQLLIVINIYEYFIAIHVIIDRVFTVKLDLFAIFYNNVYLFLFVFYYTNNI